MLKESHNTHVISSANSSSHNHSYELELANKNLENGNKNIKNEKKNTINTQLTQIQIERINDILSKYNLSSSGKNSKKINIDDDLKERLSKFELEINPEKINNIDNESYSDQDNTNIYDINNKNESNFNKYHKLIGAINLKNITINNKNDSSYLLSFKPINRETRFNNINRYNEENIIPKKINVVNTEKLLNYQQIISPRNLIRQINKPKISFITKTYKTIRNYFDHDTGMRLNVINNYDFTTKLIIEQKIKKTQKGLSDIDKQLRIQNLENQNNKKEIEEEKIPTFSSINTSSSNSVTKVKPKGKEKGKARSKTIRKKNSKLKTKIKSKNLSKNKKQSLVSNNGRLRSISMHSKISGNNRLRSVSVHSKMSNEKSEDIKSANSKKNINNNGNNNINNSNKNILNIKKSNADSSNKYNNKYSRPSRDKKFSFISKIPQKYSCKVKNIKKIDKSQITSSNSLRNISNFNSPFKKNLLNINKITESDNNKLNSSANRDKDKLYNEKDFKKYLEEQKKKRCNQIRHFIKKHGMNSYNFFYPKEPSPLFGIFKKNCSIYPTLNMNGRNTIEEEKKYIRLKNENNYSPINNQNKKEKEIIKTFKKEKKLNIKEIKENQKNYEYMHKMHIIEKHYGAEKDCPICRVFIYKKEEENDISSSKTTRYNKLRGHNKSTSMFSINSQTNISNNKKDFLFTNRNRINSSKKSENFQENQSSQINRNFNILFDYFRQ